MREGGFGGRRDRALEQISLVSNEEQARLLNNPNIPFGNADHPPKTERPQSGSSAR